MKQQRFDQQFSAIFELAVQLHQEADADALLVVLSGPTDWEKLIDKRIDKVVVAADHENQLEGAEAAGLATIILDMEHSPMYERLTQALLESVAAEILAPNAEVVAVYSGFEPGRIDTLSFLRLDEHLGRLTARDLRRLETSVPLDTLKTVIDLAVEIGREGREGKNVGTMFVIGDTRQVLQRCKPAGFDPVRGYKRAERDLRDARTREAVKEIAPLDGAIIVSSEGVVERACQLVDASHGHITLTKGLGARHWAGAAISKSTKAIAVVVSESNGTVRLFQNGEVILRVEPFRRAMKWKDFEYEPPPTVAES